MRGSAFFLQSPVRDDGRDDEPNRRKRDERIDDDRTDRARAHEDGRDEVEVEDAEHSPIERPEEHEDVGDEICNDHCVSS